MLRLSFGSGESMFLPPAARRILRVFGPSATRVALPAAMSFATITALLFFVAGCELPAGVLPSMQLFADVAVAADVLQVRTLQAGGGREALAEGGWGLGMDGRCRLGGGGS